MLFSSSFKPFPQYWYVLSTTPAKFSPVGVQYSLQLGYLGQESLTVPDGVRTTDRESRAPTGKLFFAPGGRTGASAKLKSSPKTRKKSVRTEGASRPVTPIFRAFSPKSRNLSSPSHSNRRSPPPSTPSFPHRLPPPTPSQVAAVDSLAGHRH